MTSCPETMVLRIWRFWKRVSWELIVDHVGRQLDCLPQWQTVEFEFRPWWCEVGVSTVEAYGWIFRISTGRDELRSKTPRDVPNVGGFVSIVWYERLLRIVSLLVSKKWSQKLIIKLSYLNNRESACVFAYVYVLLLLISLWSWYTTLIQIIWT